MSKSSDILLTLTRKEILEHLAANPARGVRSDNAENVADVKYSAV